MVDTKAAIGWCRHDLLSAASIITSRPRWAWYLPWTYPTYRYLVGVIRESRLFLERIGYARNPEVDHLAGKKFWFDDRGRLVRWERQG